MLSYKYMNEWRPTEENFQFKSAANLKAEELRLQETLKECYERELSATLRSYEAFLKSEDAGYKKAELGSAIIKTLLKISSTIDSPINFKKTSETLKSRLTEVYRGNTKSADNFAAGFAAEHAFAEAIVTESNIFWGADAFLPTTEEDVKWKVDVILDPQDAELTDFWNQEQQKYDYAAISIKSTGSIPPIGMPLFYTCRTMDELAEQIDNQQSTFYSYFKAQGEYQQEIDHRFQNFKSLAFDTARELHGYNPGYEQKVRPALTEKYDNIVPCVGFAPSINEYDGLYQHGLAKPSLIEQIQLSMLGELSST